MLMDDKSKLDTNTTFKLTREASHAIDLVANERGCSKDAAIRLLIGWGLEVYKEIKNMTKVSTRQVAKRLERDSRKVPAPHEVVFRKGSVDRPR